MDYFREMFNTYECYEDDGTMATFTDWMRACRAKDAECERGWDGEGDFEEVQS
jgi:hypothetical protein